MSATSKKHQCRARCGDEADLELQAAREEFRRMGAVREEAAVAAVLRAATEAVSVAWD
jgi:hypothetical protein